MKVKFDKVISKKDQRDLQKIIDLLESFRSKRDPHPGWIPGGIAEDTLSDFVQAFVDEGLATCRDYVAKSN